MPILLLALSLRLAEAQGHSLWFDEAIEFTVANHPFSEVIAVDRASTHDPPLFSLALNLWMQAGRTDFHVRLLPIFASVLAVAALFVLGQVFFSTEVGWFSALLVAIAPRSVFYGFELNQYGFVLLLTVLGALMLERYLKVPNLMRLIAFLFLSSVAILTHYELVIYWAALILVGTFSLIYQQRTPQRQRLVMSWFGGLMVLFLIGLVLLWAYALPQKARLPETFAPARFLSGPVSLTNEVGLWAAQTEELTRTLLWGFDPTPLAWLTTILLVCGTLLGLLRPGRRLAWYFIVGLGLAYFAAGVGFLVYWHRYEWYVLPLETLLICSGVFALANGRYRRYLRPIAYLVLGLLAILLFTKLPAISGIPFPETEQFGEVMRYFQTRHQKGDAIYVYYGARPAFVRYSTEDTLKNAVIQGWSRGVPAELQQANLWKAVGTAPRVWLLLSHTNPSDASVLPDALKSRCRQIDTIEVTGSAGYLFECATP